MFEEFTRLTIDTGEATIAAVTAGEGPPVLLAHGFPQTKSMWARVAPRLAERYTVVAADLRGYGDSSKPPSGSGPATYSFRSMAADQVAVMRHLGHRRFHVVGHDRGGRMGHRLALDHAGDVASLCVLDIVPTHAMFMDTNRHLAMAYWHWYFLAQPAPLPERLIASDPDFFFETCLVGWGKTTLDRFDADMLADYRRCWRDPETIRGMIEDYRAAAAVDLADDSADLESKVSCPTLALWGSAGLMHRLFDMTAEWGKRCRSLETATLPGGHFFVDQFPAETAEILLRHLDRHR
ncbi:MAG: alpha/beta fold hydrolase [Hyphomicrobium sp.]